MLFLKEYNSPLVLLLTVNGASHVDQDFRKTVVSFSLRESMHYLGSYK